MRYSMYELSAKSLAVVCHTGCVGGEERGRMTVVVSRKPEALVEFRPRPSSGRRWAGGIGLGTLALFIVPMMPAWGEIPWVVMALLVILGIVVTAPILLVAWTMSNMRYLITDSELILEMRPLINDRIRLEEITHVECRDLKNSLLSSFRFPGLAVFDVAYRDAGRVRMCATSASTGIVLISAGQKRYGVTPEDAEGFIEMLVERSDNHTEIVRSDE
jgi:hypothetical protein